MGRPRTGQMAGRALLLPLLLMMIVSISAKLSKCDPQEHDPGSALLGDEWDATDPGVAWITNTTEGNLCAKMEDGSAFMCVSDEDNFDGDSCVLGNDMRWAASNNAKGCSGKGQASVMAQNVRNKEIQWQTPGGNLLEVKISYLKYSICKMAKTNPDTCDKLASMMPTATREVKCGNQKKF